MKKILEQYISSEKYLKHNCYDTMDIACHIFDEHSSSIEKVFEFVDDHESLTVYKYQDESKIVKYVYFLVYYGSCSGCDYWLDKRDDEGAELKFIEEYGKIIDNLWEIDFDSSTSPDIVKSYKEYLSTLDLKLMLDLHLMDNAAKKFKTQLEAYTNARVRNLEKQIENLKIELPLRFETVDDLIKDVRYIATQSNNDFYHTRLNKTARRVNNNLKNSKDWLADIVSEFSRSFAHSKFTDLFETASNVLSMCNLNE